MSILIKGMKMPKNCGECKLRNGIGKNCGKVIFYCAPLVKWVVPNPLGRADDCPLIEVPKHGLIDKQMLLRNIADNQFAHSSVGHEEDYAFWGKVWDYIVDAPTIMESEE